MYISTFKNIFNLQSKNIDENSLNKLFFNAHKKILSSNYWWGSKQKVFELLLDGEYNPIDFDFSESIITMNKEFAKIHSIEDYSATNDEANFPFITYDELTNIFDELPENVVRSDIEYLFKDKNFVNEQSKTMFLEFELHFINERKKILKYCKENNFFQANKNIWNIFSFSNCEDCYFILKDGSLRYENENGEIINKSATFAENNFNTCDNLFSSNLVCILNNFSENSNILMIKSSEFRDYKTIKKVDLKNYNINICLNLQKNNPLNHTINSNCLLQIYGNQFLVNNKLYEQKLCVDFSKQDFWTDASNSISITNLDDPTIFYAFLLEKKH